MKIQENYFYKLDNSKEVKVVWKKYDKANILEIGIEYPTAIVDLDRFSGIPLTDEWLVKFGFEESEFVFSKNMYFIKGMQIWKCNDMFLCDKNGIYIKHVHQLQNLYFALTGKELTHEN